MFRLRKPCNNCPFRRGGLIGLHPERIEEIVNGPAFQCHKTVDYSEDTPGQGDRPQQCAGLMAFLHKIDQPNQIMQVAERLGYLDTDALDGRDVYDSLGEVVAAHAQDEALTRAE